MKKASLKMGERLKNLRTANKMTLDKLSAQAGVSKAMLSQIEKGKVNPTIAIILKISEALEISVSQLIESKVQKNIIRFIRHSDEDYTFRKDKSCTIRTLTPLSLEKDIEFYRIMLKAGGKLASEPHFQGTEEFLFLAKGKLSVTSGEEKIDVSQGDSIYYKADVTHILENAAKTQAEIYLIVRYRNM
jgi:transcriptional regulator with XRE-family HTH domain